MMFALGSVLLAGASADKPCNFGNLKAWVDSKPLPVTPVAPVTTVPPTTVAPVTMAPATMAPTAARTAAPTTMAPATMAPTAARTAAPTTMAPATMAPTAASTSGADCFLRDVSYPPEEQSNDPASSALECQEFCADHPECEFWTWVPDFESCFFNKGADGAAGFFQGPATAGLVSGPKRGCHVGPTTVAPTTTAPTTTAPTTSAPAPGPATLNLCQMTAEELDEIECEDLLQHVQCTDTWTTNICPGQDTPNGPQFNDVPVSNFCRTECGLPPAFEVNWNPSFGTARPLEDQELDLEPGTELTFVWTGFHNVWQTVDPARACNFNGATRISSGTSSPAKFTIPENAADGEQFHFACRVGRHCNLGQHLTVTVRRGSQQTARRRLKSDELEGLDEQCKPCVQSCIESSQSGAFNFADEDLMECLLGCTEVECDVLASEEACEAFDDHCVWDEGTGVRRRLKAGVCKPKKSLRGSRKKPAKNSGKIMSTKTQLVAGVIVGGFAALVCIAGLVRYYCKKN